MAAPKLMLVALAAQALLAEPGPLERQAKAITPENPIPRRVSFVMPRAPSDVELAGARTVVTLRVTLDAAGSVAEIRSVCCGLVSVGGGVAVNDAFVAATAEAVRQWRYEPPADPPIAFDVSIEFRPGAPPFLLTHGGQLFRQPAPPPPPPPPPPAIDTAGAPPWAAGAVRVGGSVRPPPKIKHVPPAYPPEALAAGVQGAVIIQVRIEPDGRIRNARVLRSIPALDQAALDAVLQWEFEPPMADGVPTPILMNVTVQFTAVG